jgi:hypothetical protein
MLRQSESELKPAIHEAEEIQAQMQSVRANLRADVCDLVDAAREKVDWRHYVRTYPWLCLGAAVAAGYAVIRPRCFLPDGMPAESCDKSRRIGSGNRSGAHILDGLFSSLIGAASQAMLRRGLEVLTAYDVRSVPPHGWSAAADHSPNARTNASDLR